MAERMEAGRALREGVPRSSHADFTPAPSRAVLAFAEAYADQTERDHALLVAGINDGLVPAEAGI